MKIMLQRFMTQCNRT